MKRSSSTDGGSDMNRRESYPSSSNYKSQQTLSPQQQKQIQAQQQIQQQQYQAQQQIQQQIQEFQQQQQQQQIQEFQQQQQQQFVANQQFYNQAFYNYQAYVPSQSPLLYNSGASWNYIASPSPFFGSSPSPSTQPPLPPPELKPEKPPLPKEPEPGNENQAGPRTQGTIRVRGLNGINTGIFNGLNGGPRPNGPAAGTSQRGRRRNPHFFSPMQPPSAPSAQELTRPSDFSDLAQLLEEDLPAGPEKLTIFLNSTETGRVQVNKKAKRKPMSTRYTRTKLWVREEAEAAIALEKEFNRMQKRPMLILKFPDPDLNKYIVKKYSPFIDTVHFQQPSTPRYCFVQLKEDADVDKVVNTIRQIPFGTGKISAEIKCQHLDDQPVTPEEIDPYTLYIGNLPTHISVRVVKQYFPNAQRIDIGYAQRMRYTRYAFIRYNTVAEAMESYRKTVNALLDSRSLIVRFRRQKGNIGLPGEPKLMLQKRDDKEETAAQGEKVTDNPEVLVVEDLAGGEGSERPRQDDDEGANVNVNAEAVGIPETVSKSKLPTEATNNDALNDENQTSKTETTEKRQVENTKELNENATNPSAHKETTVPTEGQNQISNTTAGEETSTTLYSPESLGDEMDSKEKVMEEARVLMEKNNEMTRKRRAVSPINFSAFVEPTEVIKGPVEGDIKLEQTDDEDSSDDGGINLLGTRIKDEPFETPQGISPTMEEIYYDDYDYDDMCSEPEDYDDSWSNNSDSRAKQMLTTNWEIVRRNELNVREDKPDLSDINSLGVDSMQESIDMTPKKAILEPKREVDDSNPQSAKKMKRDRLAVKQELEDMFNRLNSDIECDDEDAFFGHT